MVATPTRIGFVMEEWRLATSTTPVAKDRHGELARESDDPVEAYFDNVSDAQIVADARQALLSPERRHFSETVVGLDEAIGLDYLGGAIPTCRVIDERMRADRTCLVAEIGFDFAKQRATFRAWG